MKNNIELTWEQENDLVIETILEKFFNSTNRENNMNVELQITADCNQKCEYCYLYKNKEELYPKDIRNPKIILKNLNIILNYFLEKKYEIKEFDLFSGEIWSSQFGIDVLTAMLYYVAKAEFKPNRISIPSNGYFILNEKYLEQILEIRKQMLYYGTNLSFSISIDGPLLEEQNRSLINEKNNFLRDEKFYEKMFNFCKTYNFGFHPMVNAYNIEKWPAQYEWWIDKLNEYDLNYFDYIMFLEVRNNEWTNDKIESYLKFLNFAFEKTLSDIFNNDKESLLNVILGTDSSPRETFNYFHLNLLKSSINMGC